MRHPEENLSDPHWAERETWACGPAGLLDEAEAHWTEHGIQERLHTERFRPRIVAGEGGDAIRDQKRRELDLSFHHPRRG